MLFVSQWTINFCNGFFLGAFRGSSCRQMTAAGFRARRMSTRCLSLSPIHQEMMTSIIPAKAAVCPTKSAPTRPTQPRSSVDILRRTVLASARASLVVGAGGTCDGHTSLAVQETIRWFRLNAFCYESITDRIAPTHSISRMTSFPLGQVLWQQKMAGTTALA